MPYVTVFEITRQAIPLWFPVSFLFFILWGAVVLSLARNHTSTTKFARAILLVFACLWVLAAAYYFLGRSYIQAYKNEKFSVVEGAVEHYSWRGKTECFTVRGVEFCHGTANQVGWDPPFRLGPATWPVGLTPEGSLVRVAYYTNGESHTLLRLDVTTTAYSPKRSSAMEKPVSK